MHKKFASKENAEIMTTVWRVISLISIALLIVGWSFVEASQEPIQGPVVMSQYGPQVTLQDIGSGRVWGREVGANTTFVSWSPDGCKILLIQRSTNNAQWLLLPVNELEPDNLPSQIKSPIWYPDGQSLTYKNYADDTNMTTVYSFGLKNQESSFLFEAEGVILPIQWLSENELLYTKDGYRFVWNAATQQTRLFGTDHYPRYAKTEDTASRFFYYKDDISPNQELLVGFYDIASYRSALDPRDNHLTDEYVQKIESQKPEITGFDVYALNEGVSRHVDVNDAFVESVSWSPSSRMIAVTTDYRSEDYAIYIYDLTTDILERVADAYNDLWYIMYIPSWSPDEQWLAFNTPEGYAIQRLSDDERVLLDPELNGDQVHWSPVIDYSDVDCKD